MSEADRDDLEAALARATELEREIDELRTRNAELEASPEARENARRLAAALERERAEEQQHHQTEVDDAHWRQASRIEARRAKAANATLRSQLASDVRGQRLQPPTNAEIGLGAIGFAVALIAWLVTSEALYGVAFVLVLVGSVVAGVRRVR